MELDMYFSLAFASGCAPAKVITAWNFRKIRSYTLYVCTKEKKVDIFQIWY